MSATLILERPVMDPEEYLSQEDLAKRWKVSLKTIRRKRQSGELPAFRVTRNLFRFKLKDILQIEKNGQMFPAIAPRPRTSKKKQS